MSNLKMQETTIWSFPDRGNWATHKGDYRGNWSPYVPRNLILKYSNPGDLILDNFVGSGTTLIEAKILGRNAIGIDVNTNAINITKERLMFDNRYDVYSKLFLGDARDMPMLENDSIDFVCTHPPYANIIKYSNNLSTDLSLLEYKDFLHQMNSVSKEMYRVLKKGKYCSFMIGDIRKHGNIIPLGFYTMQAFIKNGFTLKEIIIKEQHNCTSTSYWKDKVNKLNFYLIAHEYIIFCVL